MEPLSISSLIISIALAIAFLINKIHLKHCKMGCIDSDCRSPNNSPDNSQKDLKLDDIVNVINKTHSMPNITDV